MKRWKMGKHSRGPEGFDKRPTTQCEENGENGCSQPPRTSTIKPCELARPNSDINLHYNFKKGDEFKMAQRFDVKPTTQCEKNCVNTRLQPPIAAAVEAM